MRRQITYTLLLLAVFCSGCAFQIPRGWDTEVLEPRPTSHVALTQTWINTLARDPANTIITYIDPEPSPGYVCGPFLTVGPDAWVWRVQLNGPNAFGGMTGVQSYYFATHDGQVRAFPYDGSFAVVRRVDEKTR